MEPGSSIIVRDGGAATGCGERGIIRQCGSMMADLRRCWPGSRPAGVLADHLSLGAM